MDVNITGLFDDERLPEISLHDYFSALDYIYDEDHAHLWPEHDLDLLKQPEPTEAELWEQWN